ncbi:hypothetical protein GBF38_017903 [Nibea albiflora]|uniref:Uncharacterized protein n=1 Tax=Nibea albiflora TaxID=240163 RepID=A0ACB7F5U0_NIBAL|nr:hypothetical protein GBF38_017903 [Nibea albiflora]
MAAGLLLLVCAGAVLYSAEAQDPYNELPDSYKKGVDLSLEQLNSHDGSGFGVQYFYHHFYLKPTSCAKGTTESDPQRCPFRNDREMRTTRTEHCRKMSYNSGAPTLLAVSTG